MELKNILLVDDDEGVNFLNKYLLNDSKVAASIAVALNGRDALKHIADSGICPDIIFLDINMPVMDGFDFLENFKNLSPCFNKSKVYMLTSSLRDSDRAKAAVYECVVDYLEKPLSEEVIKSIFYPTTV